MAMDERPGAVLEAGEEVAASTDRGSAASATLTIGLQPALNAALWQTRDTAVSFRYVEGGVNARAGARTNQVEARAVVAEALAVPRATLAGGPARSLGIVTFNAEQQGLIEDLLDSARRDDPSLEPFFSDDATDPVLV